MPTLTPEQTKYFQDQIASIQTGIDKYKAGLAPAQAPTNASGVNQIATANMPTIQPQTPTTSGVGGLMSFYEKQFEVYQKQQDDIETQQKELKTNQEKQAKPFLDKLLGSKSPSDTRKEAQEETGVIPKEYFAAQQASLAEMGTLQEDYNAEVSKRDTEINRIRDNKAGMLSGAIDSEVARTERDYAVRLNEKSANIKAKAAVFEARQGNFQEAQNYVNQAVNDATADLKFNMDMFKTFYDLNQDQIDRLDTKYSSALKSGMEAAEKAYTLEREDKMQVGKLLLDNPQAGISISDSLDEALTKVGITPRAEKGEVYGSAETGYYERYYDPVTNTYRSKLLPGGGGGTAGNESGFLDVMQQSIDAGATPEQAAQEAVRASEALGIPVDQKTLSQWTAQARKLKKTPATASAPAPTPVPAVQKGRNIRSVLSYYPEAQDETFRRIGGVGQSIGSFFSGLFGG